MSPGPCLTEMFGSIAATSFSARIRGVFQGQMDSGEVLSCQESISKLVKILRENTYDNGVVIDYYEY